VFARCVLIVHLRFNLLTENMVQYQHHMISASYRIPYHEPSNVL
jgi:hypothetical protein